MTESDVVKPLGKIVEIYLWMHSHLSLRAIVLGKDPDNTPQYIVAHQGRWINRDTLVDWYAIAWPLIGWLLLWQSMTSLRGHPICALVIGAIVVYRINELLGGVLYVLILRARHDFADARKLAISLLAYLEPVLFFAVLHAISSVYLNGSLVCNNGAGYSLGGRSWTWVTVLHYSIGCYTTVGWGDVSAVAPMTMMVSDVETVTGVLMITLTISRFVAAAMDASMTKAVEELSRQQKNIAGEGPS